jgi:acyl-CoA synthetase (AMP-forming)/AMP-acid ligase II
VDGDTRYSYTQLRNATQVLATAMRANGLEAEDRMAIYSLNDARVLVCMLSIMRAGGAWVPINYRNAIDANIEFVKYAEIRWLFYHSSFQEQVEQIRKLVPSVRNLICVDASVGDDPSLEQFMARNEPLEEADWGPGWTRRQSLPRQPATIPSGCGVAAEPHTAFAWRSWTMKAAFCRRIRPEKLWLADRS